MTALWIIGGMLAGWLTTRVVGHFQERADDKLLNSYRTANCELARALRNLRANAYLTDERGVRVRYAKASAEVRAKAES